MPRPVLSDLNPGHFGKKSGVSQALLEMSEEVEQPILADGVLQKLQSTEAAFEVHVKSLLDKFLLQLQQQHLLLVQELSQPSGIKEVASHRELSESPTAWQQPASATAWQCPETEESYPGQGSPARSRPGESRQSSKQSSMSSSRQLWTKPGGAARDTSEEDQVSCEFPEPTSPLQSRKDELFDLFRELDTENTGALRVDVMREALKGDGEHPARARKLLDAVCLNEDGKIELGEWESVVSDFAEGRGSESMRAFASTLSKYDHPSQASTSKFELEEDRWAHRAKLPWYMISFDSRRRVFWDLSLIVLLLYLATVLPFAIAFIEEEEEYARPDPTTNPLDFIDSVIDIAFMVDIILNFFTTYADKDGIEVVGLKQVMLHYLKSWFAIDLLSSIPFGYFAAGVPTLGPLKMLKSGRMVRVAKLLRLVKIAKILSTSELVLRAEELTMLSASQSTFDLARILLSSCVLCHMLACCMSISGKGFLEKYRYFDESIWSRYVSSMYWALATVTTVGYGDIVPSTDEERLYTMVAMILGGGFYGYVVGNISVIIANSDLNKQNYKSKMRLLGAWLTHHKFPKALRRRVWTYYKAYLTHKTALDESSLIEDLSPQLRAHVADYLIHPVVRNNLIFHNLPTTAIVRLLNVMQKITAVTDEQIAEIGHVGHGMFIIIDGIVAMERERTRKSSKGSSCSSASTKTAKTRTDLLYAGDSFGEEVLLGITSVYDYNINAKSLCVMIMIRVELFMTHFANVPEVLIQMENNFTE